MDISLLVILLFLAVLLSACAIILLLRDLAFSRRDDQPEKPSLRLQTEPRPGRGGLAGRFDSWFDRLVTESGLGIGPWTAFLAMLFCGAFLGALVLLWTDLGMAALGVGVLGMSLPLAFFAYKRYSRFRVMDQQLPSILDLMTRAVRAGQSIDGAFKLAGESGQQPTAGEFAQVARQLEMGLSMSAAMESFVRRVSLHEIRILASALRVQRRTGGNIAQVIRRVAKVIRDRQSYRRTFRATTAGARLALALVGLCLPAYLIFMLYGQPEYGMQLFNHPHGIAIFVGAIALMLIGAIWIGRTLKSEY